MGDMGDRAQALAQVEELVAALQELYLATQAEEDSAVPQRYTLGRADAPIVVSKLHGEDCPEGYYVCQEGTTNEAMSRVIIIKSERHPAARLHRYVVLGPKDDDGLHDGCTVWLQVDMGAPFIKLHPWCMQCNKCLFAYQLRADKVYRAGQVPDGDFWCDCATQE